MKKNDLKKLIKPLVKECIHEVLLEEGLLSNVVSEVAKGMQGNLVTETQTPQPARARERLPKVDKTKQILEQRKKMMAAVGADAYNGVDLFEGTEPLSSHEATTNAAGSVDLGNPRDAGVDISSIMGGASKIWKAMK
jgi:hypothetical protein